MGAGKVIGGIIAMLLGVWMVLYETLVFHLNVFNMSQYGGDWFLMSLGISTWIWNLAVGVIGLIGCILAYTSRKQSGILLVVSGGISIFFGLYNYFMPTQPTGQYTFWATMGLGPFFGITVEALAILVGGIICLASASKSK